MSNCKQHVFILLEDYKKHTTVLEFMRGNKYKCIYCRILSYASSSKECGHKCMFLKDSDSFEQYICNICEHIFTVYLTDNRNENNNNDDKENSTLLIKDHY